MPFTQGLWMVFVCHEKQFPGGRPTVKQIMAAFRVLLGFGFQISLPSKLLFPLRYPQCSFFFFLPIPAILSREISFCDIRRSVRPKTTFYTRSHLMSRMLLPCATQFLWKLTAHTIYYFNSWKDFCSEYSVTSCPNWRTIEKNAGFLLHAVCFPNLTFQ